MEMLAEEFIHKLGAIASGEGIPKIAGMIMGYFIYFGRSATLDDLAQELVVSKASVSTNCRLLIHLGVIEKLAKLGSRKIHFQLRDDPYEDLISMAAKRLNDAEVVVERFLCEVDEPKRFERISALKSFYGDMGSMLSGHKKGNK
mgnify:CR=1 FL=1